MPDPEAHGTSIIICGTVTNIPDGRLVYVDAINTFRLDDYTVKENKTTFKCIVDGGAFCAPGSFKLNGPGSYRFRAVWYYYAEDVEAGSVTSPD